METPECCKKFMELKGVYPYESGNARMFFQCKKCGKVDIVGDN